MQQERHFTPIGEIIQDILGRLRNGEMCNCEFPKDVIRGDSYLEKMFWHMMLKTEIGWHGAVDQLQIGKYRVDVIADCNGQSVVVELDGKQYHDSGKDAIRDAEILNHVDAIVRIPYYSMAQFRYGVFHLLGMWFPRFRIPSADWAVISRSELQESVEDWLSEDADAIDVWDEVGSVGFLGTPRQFAANTPKAVVRVQYGNGRKEIIDRIYRKADCRQAANLVWRSAA